MKRPNKGPRSFVVTRNEARRTVADLLHRRLALSWARCRELVRDGNVQLDNRPCRDSTLRLQRGQRLTIELPEKPVPQKPPKPQRAATRPSHKGVVIRHVDEHIVVVEKPAGLTTMRHREEAAEFGPRGRKFLPATLADMLPGLLAKSGRKGITRVRPVHRIDNETSGLVVFALTAAAESHLGKQFRAHTVERRYIALVRGEAKDARIESWLVRDRGDGRRGSGSEDGEGQRAVTQVRVLERLGDFTLVECKLETGRTHQVRIHLGEAGTPLCGERVYDRPVNGKPLPDVSSTQRVTLHAATLGFIHPSTGNTMKWTSQLPKDVQAVLEDLRRRCKR